VASIVSLGRALGVEAVEAWTVQRLPQPTAATAGVTSVPVPDEALNHMQQTHDAGEAHATIAAALSQRGSRHPLGRQWHRTSVARFLSGTRPQASVSA
jgi:hypothetical protein